MTTHAATEPPAGPRKDARRWYRGQLHAHSYWSDGRGFLEQAAAAHQERGYHFMFISDHNRLGTRPDEWRRIAEEEGPWPPMVSRENFERYLNAFGPEWVEQRAEPDGTRSVRLKTLDEVKTRMDAPGKFLLLPGVELTQAVDGRHVHTNYLNVPRLIPVIQQAPLVQAFEASTTLPALLARNAAEVRQAAAEEDVPYALMLNHPFWRYYDVDPRDVIDRFDYHLVEICGGGSGMEYPPFEGAAAYTLERFWDMVNAFRLRAGGPLLYGTGADDAHYYDPDRVENRAGVGTAWVMVRAAALTPDALIAALLAGDFYTSTGVLLTDLSFDPAANTLRVQVYPEPDTNYRIVFITTKADFDPGLDEVTASADGGRRQRKLPVCSEQIGQIAGVVEGPDASFQLTPDDLYVRARVESSRPAKHRGKYPVFPAYQGAWTQPYRPVFVSFMLHLSDHFM